MTVLPGRYQLFIDKALSVLQVDERILGIGVQGSLKSGEVDEYSDIDLVLLIDEAAYEGILDERKDIAAKLGDMVAAFTGEHVGAPELLICLYREENLHVDLKFCPPSVLTAGRFENPKILWERGSALTDCLIGEPTGNPQPDLQWIEDRFWVWIHYMTAKLGRGELTESAGGLEFLRNLVLLPMLRLRRQVNQRGTRRAEIDLPSDMKVFRTTYCSEVTKTEIGRALQTQIALYEVLRDDLDKGQLERKNKAEAFAKEWLAGILNT